MRSDFHKTPPHNQTVLSRLPDAVLRCKTCPTVGLGLGCAIGKGRAAPSGLWPFTPSRGL